MKKLLIPLLLSSLFALALSSCTPPLTKGYVYDKQYSAEWVQYVPGYFGRSCSGSGSSRSCSTYYVPGYTIDHPAEYYLDLTTCSSLQTDGQCKTGWIDVDSETYSRYRIGQYYNG